MNLVSAKYRETTSTKFAISVCTGLSSMIMNAVLITAFFHRTTTLDLMVKVKTTYNMHWSLMLYSTGASFYCVIHVLLIVEIYFAKRKYNARSFCFSYNDYPESAPLTKEKNPKAVPINVI
ncbi:hypothetical protein ElyMa_005570000 [Elysia marginata]|uniref:G-protein coupled receptors family 1 profile domain-containing protein n=1 Tax=Elysia marginata TaxID=1093978 RepID=A0AAV4F0S3_9GAST|nr:hypothetical protein ElyMa_005570000 [Elysia marginata]